MAEINNNLTNYRINTERTIDTKNIDSDSIKEKEQDIKNKSSDVAKYIADTGVLGRSQVKNPKGSDVTRSIDETIALIDKHPEIIECGDELFDTLYEQFLSDGMSNSEAYEKASLAMEEFVEISKAQLAKILD